MNVIYIGKGFCRTIVRSGRKRERLGRVPEVSIYGERVIFPEWMTENVRKIIEGRRRIRRESPEQVELFERRADDGTGIKRET
jgi:hypothetical protein